MRRLEGERKRRSEGTKVSEVRGREVERERYGEGKTWRGRDKVRKRYGDGEIWKEGDGRRGRGMEGEGGSQLDIILPYARHICP